MDYELVTIIRPEDKVWKESKQRIEGNGKVISILPSPDFARLKRDEEVEGINLFDYLTNRKYDLTQFLFFNQAPVPSFSEIFMNEDFSISIIHEGEEIGIMELFPNTRRLVKNVQYHHGDGEKDFVQEYTIDGKIFSEIFYFNNRPQEIHFYNEKHIPIISYYFYEGKLNYITFNDEKTGEPLSGFNSLDLFIAEQLPKIVTPKDRVTISFLGIELAALSKTKSHNILQLVESPVDDNGNVKGNLLHILKNDIKYIQEVKMSLEYKQMLIKKGVPVSKVTTIKRR